jgi:hypothetical protein
MSTRKIFTKRFVTLTPQDQAAVVDMAIHEREMAVGASPADEAALSRSIRRIERKAVMYGVYGAEKVVETAHGKDQ